ERRHAAAERLLSARAVDLPGPRDPVRDDQLLHLVLPAADPARARRPRRPGRPLRAGRTGRSLLSAVALRAGRSRRSRVAPVALEARRACRAPEADRGGELAVPPERQEVAGARRAPGLDRADGAGVGGVVGPLGVGRERRDDVRHGVADGRRAEHRDGERGGGERNRQPARGVLLRGHDRSLQAWAYAQIAQAYMVVSKPESFRIETDQPRPLTLGALVLRVPSSSVELAPPPRTDLPFVQRTVARRRVPLSTGVPGSITTCQPV